MSASNQTCGNCQFWHRGSPGIARAERDPSLGPDEGACQLTLPFVIAVAGGIVSVWPVTHADRTCGEWDARDDAGPGGGEVIHLRPRPAA